MDAVNGPLAKPCKFGLCKGERAPALNDWGASKGVVLALAMLYPDRQELHGSGVMVSAGVAFGAAHVMQQSLTRTLLGSVGPTCFVDKPEVIRIVDAQPVCDVWS